jgi:hypothetical protein
VTRLRNLGLSARVSLLPAAYASPGDENEEKEAGEDAGVGDGMQGCFGSMIGGMAGGDIADIGNIGDISYIGDNADVVASVDCDAGTVEHFGEDDSDSDSVDESSVGCEPSLFYCWNT